MSGKLNLWLRFRCALWLFFGSIYALFSSKFTERIMRGYFLAIEEDTNKKLDALNKRQAND